MAESWKLYAGDELVAGLAVTGGGFPWLEAELRPEPGFERFRGLFTAHHTATDAEDWEAADAAYYEIRRVLRLENPKGDDVPEFLLHIEGDQAWWRWSDEPFEQG